LRLLPRASIDFLTLYATTSALRVQLSVESWLTIHRTGRAVKVGSKVKDIKVGDRVGVGAQVGADLTCDNCKADQENYCPNQ
jgi:threonine dehydrogenase-like Zn-dependent dehydrogenase